MNKTCQNIVLLHGDYGLGKTEFAIDIAKMLTCENLTFDGYCGVCKYCTVEITENSFLTSIALINTPKIENRDKLLELVKESTTAVHTNNKVYIFDEFHSIPPEQQEVWLSASRNLDNTYLILTTTQRRKIDKGIQSRSLKLRMEKIGRTDMDKLLTMYNLPGLSPEVMTELFRVHGGVPRDIIISARFLLHSGLDEDEKLEFISRHKRIQIGEIFKMVHNRLLFIREVRTLDTLYPREDIVRAIEDFVYDNLALGQKNYSKEEISTLIPYDYLIWILRHAEDYKVMFIQMLQKIAEKPAGADKQAVLSVVNPPQKSEGEEIKRW
jgi:hypothetical protein